MNQIKILSPTFALDLTTSASAALQIVPSSPTRAYRVALLNTNMIYPMIIDCGAPDLYIKGISSGTNTLYITLVATE